MWGQPYGQRMKSFVLRGLWALVGGLLAVAPFTAGAQPYPNKAVRIVVGFPPGQATDILARLLAERLQKSLGQPFVVENRPGAGGTTAVAAAARSPADGYTLIMTSAGPHSIAPSLYASLGYDPVADFTPLSLIATIPQFVYAHPGFAGSTVRGLVDEAKRNPKHSYASSGNGLPGHIIMEAFKKEAGFALLHVPYRGSVPALTDVIAGHVPIGIDTAATVLPMYRAGKVKVLGVTSRQRTAVAPEVLSMAEQGFPAFDYAAWIGIVAPAKLPAPVAKTLTEAMARALAEPEVKAQIAALGLDGASLQGPAFERWIRDELKRWTVAVKQSGAKLD